jgi:hypothetical protein
VRARRGPGERPYVGRCRGAVAVRSSPPVSSCWRAFALPWADAVDLVAKYYDETAGRGPGGKLTVEAVRAVADDESIDERLRTAALRLALDERRFADPDSTHRGKGLSPGGFDHAQPVGVIGPVDVEELSSARWPGIPRAPWRGLHDE